MNNAKFAGRVLSTREENRYHDSYFYALVWDDEQGKPVEIMYGSTAWPGGHSDYYPDGWMHPQIDATPERRSAYEAYLAKQREERAERAARHVANTPDKGKRVRVVKGRKIEIGTEGKVFWFGKARSFSTSPRDGHKKLLRAMLGPDGKGEKEGFRVGIQTDAGEKVFTAATNVEVILTTAPRFGGATRGTT